jgi:hypothetical protein
MSLSGTGRSDWATWGFFYPVYEARAGDDISRAHIFRNVTHDNFL